MNADSLLAPLALSFQLAAITTVILVVISTPIAWWLARTSSRLKPFVQTTVALPIVLPPTVMGFYLLLLLGPGGAILQSGSDAGGQTNLVFSHLMPVAGEQAAITGLGQRQHS